MSQVLPVACMATLLALACPVKAQQSQATVSREQAVKDTLKLLELLELSHPDPFTVMGGKIAFERKAHELVSAIPAEGLTTSELGNRLSAFLAGLHDGHTHLMGGADKWRDPAWWLPVEFGIASDGLFIVGTDITALKGTRGSRLVAVNGAPLEQIREMAAREMGWENLYGEYAGTANVVRSEKFIRNLFPGSGDSVVYTLQAPGGTTSDRKIGWSEKRRWDQDTAIEKPVIWTRVEATDPFYYRLLDDYDSAYLRVSTIMGREAYEDAWRHNWGDAREMVENYYKRQKKDMPERMEDALAGIPSFLNTAEEMLREMKRRQTANLIIDLRGNGGGVTPSVYPFLYEMYGDRFYGRSSKIEYVTVESQLYLDKFHTSAEEKRKADPDFRVGSYRWDQDEPGDARAQRERAMASYTQAKFSFAPRLAALNGEAVYTPKKVVVICDSGTFSAAFHFMFYLHELGARVVGVPSSQSPNAFMEETEFRLPETGLRGSISNSMQLFLPDDPHASVFHPDFEMDWSIFARYDFDRHAAVRYALDLLAKRGI